MKPKTVNKRIGFMLALAVLALGLPLHTRAGESPVAVALKPYVMSNWRNRGQP